MKKSLILIIALSTGLNAAAMLLARPAISSALDHAGQILIAKRAQSAETENAVSKLEVAAGMQTNPEEQFRSENGKYALELTKKRDNLHIESLASAYLRKISLGVAALSVADIGAMQWVIAQEAAAKTTSYGYYDAPTYAELAFAAGCCSLPLSAIFVGMTSYALAINPKLISVLDARIEEQKRILYQKDISVADSVESRVQSNN